MDPLHIVNVLLLEEIEEAEEGYMLNLHRRRIRDYYNPFDIPNYYFKQMFRFEKEMAAEIIAEISPFMLARRYISGISRELKILATLSYFANGSYQKVIGQDFALCMSQPMISRAIAEVTDVFVNHLLPNHIRFPQTPESFEHVKNGFYQKFNVGGIIGAVDGTHIAINAPPNNDEEHPPIVYYNRKGYYSINTQVICDSDMIILSANARFPGSTHDSAIWASSSIRRKLANLYLQGDSGYPIEPWLLTPIEGAAAGSPEARYTHHHKTMRNTVERCIGVLKMRFRCLTKARCMHYHPIRAGKMIYACMILHNLAIRFNLNVDDEDYDEEEIDEDEPPVNNPFRGISLLAEGRRVRGAFIRNYFQNN